MALGAKWTIVIEFQNLIHYLWTLRVQEPTAQNPHLHEQISHSGWIFRSICKCWIYWIKKIMILQYLTVQGSKPELLRYLVSLMLHSPTYGLYPPSTQTERSDKPRLAASWIPKEASRKYYDYGKELPNLKPFDSCGVCLVKFDYLLKKGDTTFPTSLYLAENVILKESCNHTPHPVPQWQAMRIFPRASHPSSSRYPQPTRM
jgi:hypothetical protein